MADNLDLRAFADAIGADNMQAFDDAIVRSLAEATARHFDGYAGALESIASTNDRSAALCCFAQAMEELGAHRKLLALLAVEGMLRLRETTVNKEDS